jgi:hypothetical protein
MAATIGIGTALMGAGSSLAGIFGGSPAQNTQMPNMFQMPNMGGAAGGAYNMAQTIGGMPNIPGQLFPQFEQSAGNILNNPGAGGMLQGAQGAANMGAQGAGTNFGLGQFLSGAGTSMVPYAGQIMQQGFDPQQALYGRTQQQLQEQTRASEAARGLGNSPFGAGIENKAMSDFNIDWQNNQLQREATAGGAATTMLGGAGNAITAGAGLMAGAPGQLQQSSMFPYQAYNQMGGDQFNALNTLSGAGLQTLTTPQAQQNAYLQYLQAGNQSGQVANQTGQLGLNQAQLGFNQQQTLGSNLGKSLSMLGGSMGGSGSGGTASSFFPSSSFMSGGMGWG